LPDFSVRVSPVLPRRSGMLCPTARGMNETKSNIAYFSSFLKTILYWIKNSHPIRKKMMMLLRMSEKDWLSPKFLAISPAPLSIRTRRKLVAIITMGLFTAGWMRYPSKNLAMTVYLFVTMGYFIYALNIQRQYIAMAVIMFGIKWLNEDWKDMPKFFACVIIASLFHTSALIMIPAYFLLRKNWPLLFWFCVYLLAGVLCLIKWPVMKFVYHYLDGKVRFITMLTYFTTEFSPILIAIFAILSVMAVYFRGRLLRKSPQNTVLVNSMFTALLGYSFLTYIFGGAMIGALGSSISIRKYINV
jgi:hypothetical protein